MRIAPSFRMFFALILLMVCASCYRDTFKDTSSTSVQGFVRDRNGNRLKGALVFSELYDNHAITDEKGHYELGHLSAGVVSVVASHTLYLPRRQKVEVKNATIQTGINFTLEEEPGLIYDVTSSPTLPLSNILRRTIRWKTRFLGDSQVEFGLDPSFGRLSARNTSFSFDHEVVIDYLKPLESYFFRVRSYDQRGYLYTRDGINFIPREFNEDPGPPEPPLQLRASLGELQGEIRLNWNHNPFNGDVIGYNIERAVSKAGPWKKINSLLVPRDFTTYNDQNLNILQKFYYRVVAVDGEELTSAPTDPVAILPTGEFTGKQLWLKRETPYEIRGDIVLKTGSSLEVEKGVDIVFASDTRNLALNGDRIEWQVEGRLTLFGTASEPVRLIDAFGAKNGWGGLYFPPLGEACRLDFPFISGCRDHGLDIQRNNIALTGAKFSNGGRGIRLKGLKDFNLDGVGMTNVDYPLEVMEGSNLTIKNQEYFGAIRGARLENVTSATLAYNDFRSFSQEGILFNNPRGDTHLHHNILSAASGTAIHCLNGSGTITFNTLHTPATGLRCINGNFTVKNNIVVSLPRPGGIGIFREGGTTAPIFNSVVNFVERYKGVNGLSDPNLSIPDFAGGVPFDYQLNDGDPHLTAGENGAQMGRYGGL